jgi:hypothetical protein
VRAVVALYVDPMGPYPSLLGLENCWSIERDAKRYDGPHPVIAHPDCGPWSRLRHLCRHQDPECGLHAIAQVQAYGGVLEHPADSKLWLNYGLPSPDYPADKHGGYTLRVNQVSWGHVCAKPTWLYCVRVDKALAESGIRTGGTPTHCVCKGPGSYDLPVASKAKKRRSPRAFAEWLITLARSVP